MTTSANPPSAPGSASNQQLAQAISAWMDGDSSATLPTDSFDESVRSTWNTYHLIGDVLRTPDLALTINPDFGARLANALDQEAIVFAPAAASATVAANARASGWRQYAASSLAMAAAVAAVVLVARPFLAADNTQAGGTSVAVTIPAQNSTNTTLATAGAVTAASAETPVAPDYVAAHRQLAGPAAVRQVSFGGLK